MNTLQQNTTLRNLFPKGKYVGTSNEEIRRGFALTILFGSIGYGLSAKIMGKEFTKYAVYGGMWAICSETLAIIYTRYMEGKSK